VTCPGRSIATTCDREHPLDWASPLRLLCADLLLLAGSMTTDQTGPDQVHFTLLENGLDFVWSAVEHLSVGTSKRGPKYALLHLVSGIELILKERLRREDWKLLFPKPDKADEVLYKTGAFKSVDFGQLIDRVEGYCFDGDWEAAESLRAVRQQ
jgi:hypothetical protein